MFSYREGLEITTLMVVENMEDAQAIQAELLRQGIRSVLRESGSDQDMLIVSNDSLGGVEIIINSADAERAVEILYEAGFYTDTEELTDEELEALALSMEEITGMPEEE